MITCSVGERFPQWKHCRLNTVHTNKTVSCTKSTDFQIKWLLTLRLVTLWVNLVPNQTQQLLLLLRLAVCRHNFHPTGISSPTMYHLVDWVDLDGYRWLQVFLSILLILYRFVSGKSGLLLKREAESTTFVIESWHYTYAFKWPMWTFALTHT